MRLFIRFSKYRTFFWVGYKIIFKNIFGPKRLTVYSKFRDSCKYCTKTFLGTTVKQVKKI